MGSPYSILAGGSFTLAAGASQVVTVRFRPTVAGTFAGNVNVSVGSDTLSRGVTGSTTAVAMVELSVTMAGTGSGAVTSAPAGISCGATCTASVPIGTPMTLTAAATSGSTFASWGGACSGTATSCAWTMNVSATVTATFNLPLAAVPVVSSLAPVSTSAGSAATTLIVNGSGFVASSVVRWNGAARTTTVMSATQLRADLTAADLATATSVLVSVFTPTPGGGTSGTLGFTVTPVAPVVPVPVASSLSPVSALAGSGATTLTVNGSGFVASSVVRWNGAARTTTLMSATRLHAAITASDLATVGSNPVSVFTPTPGGGASATLSFATTAAVPVVPGAPTQLSVTLLGTDASGATFVVAWGAASGATSYRYTAAFSNGGGAQQGTVTGLVSFQLGMAYPASGKAFGGFVCVRSVGATGLQSADHACGRVAVPARPPVSVIPVPVASGISPATAVAGSAGFTLTVNGSGFVSSSVARWNGAPRTTTVVSATQLRIAIAASDLATPGSVPVSVFTPAPGGGVSGILGFSVTAAPIPSTPPATPTSPSVTQVGVDAGGVTLAIAWGAVSTATSYSYVTAFGDGSAAQRGAVTSPSVQLRMPYHVSGAASGGFVCIRSVNAAGQPSTDQACNGLQVPAR